MSDKEERLFDRLLMERIEIILESSGVVNKLSKFELEKAGAVLRELPEDEKNCMEMFIDSLSDLSARQGELLYKKGLYDGIRIMKRLKSI